MCCSKAAGCTRDDDKAIVRPATPTLERLDSSSKGCEWSVKVWGHLEGVGCMMVHDDKVDVQ